VTEGLAECERALKVDSDDTDALVQRGWMLLNRGDAKAALADFNQASLIDPQSAHAAYGRTWALLALHRPEAAMASLDMAIRLAPDDDKMRGARLLLSLIEGDLLTIGFDTLHFAGLAVRSPA